MRHGLRVLLALTSCCYLLVTSGCSEENNNGIDPVDVSAPVESDEDRNSIEQAPLPVIPDPVEPVAMVPVPPAPLSIVDVGGGGGSGGGSQPADTGNPDNDPPVLTETFCFDGIDNDEDGTIDCADNDCLGKPCNDEDGCSLSDTCVAINSCVGTAVDCDGIIQNECALTACVSINDLPGDENYYCTATLNREKGDFGSCQADENCRERDEFGACIDVIDTCTLGRCIEVVDNEDDEDNKDDEEVRFVCEGANKVNLTEADGGCLNGNPCNSYDCEEGECVYDLLDHVLCDDGDVCTANDTCIQGECLPGSFRDFGCLNNEECELGSVCTSIPGICNGFAIVQCVLDSDCPLGSNCLGSEIGGCTCDDENDCTNGSICGDERCVPVSFGVQGCDTDEDCASGECDGEVCVCSDGDACTANDSCIEGQCSGEVYPDNCQNDEDCPLGTDCLGIVVGFCQLDPQTSCITSEDCQVGACINGQAGFCSCDDDVLCTISSCNADGNCNVVDLDNEECEIVDNECVEQTCTETGCLNTIIDGDIPCTLFPANLSYELEILLSGASLQNLACNIGLLECDDGEQDSDCEVLFSFIEFCSEATLQANCVVEGQPIDLTPELANNICDELFNVLNP